MNRRTKAIQKNGDYWSYNYNKRSEIISGKRHLAATSPQSGLQLEYSYDSIGNRLSASTGGSPSGTHLRHQSHTANPLNQYTNISTPGYLQITGEANPAANVTVNNQSTVRQGRHFHHELNVDNTTGPVYQNIDVEATRSAHTPMQTQGSLFLAPASHSPTYDPDGNLKVDARWSYTWNAENRLIAMQTHPAAYSAGTPRHKLEFAYDSQGRRFSKKAYTWDTSTHSYALESSYRYLYDGWNLIAQLDALNTPTPTVHSTYTWGLDLSGSPQGAGGVGGLLIVTDKTGSTYLPTYDSNGNVMGYFQTDTETLVAEYEYGPFGEPIRATGNKKDEFNFRFSTKYEDAETGFLYYGFRYYDATTGRWLSRDPLGEYGGLNLYGMVGNDSVNRLDYLGLRCCKDECQTLGSRQNVKVSGVALSRGDMNNKPIDLNAGQELLDSISMVGNLGTMGTGGLPASVAKGAISGGAKGVASGVVQNRSRGFAQETPGSGLSGLALEMGAGIQHQQAMNLSARIHVTVEWEECKEKRCPRGPSSNTHNVWKSGNSGEHTCTFGSPPIAGRDIGDAQWDRCIQAAINKFKK